MLLVYRSLRYFFAAAMVERYLTLFSQAIMSQP